MTETEKNGERLSALVDGELSGIEYAHAVDAIHLSPELKLRWKRYHIAADALKKGLPPALLKSDFSARVMQAVENEPVILAPRKISYKINPAVKQLAGLAIAASVTAVAVLGAQTWHVQGQAADPAAIIAKAAPPPVNQNVAAPVVNAAMDPVTTVAVDNPTLPAHVQLQINQYLLNHNQNTLAAQRMLPYARIVGYASGETAE